MRIIFSRKGFDSSYGGVPSPIVDGRPVSLPIPAAGEERTTYGELGLANRVKQATRGRISGTDRCHDDPMFAGGHCWLGQAGAAQGHLRGNGVGPGDVFLFFGLFADPESGERHHRLFGYMRVLCHGAPEAVARDPQWRSPPRAHPHCSGDWGTSNCIYFGRGNAATNVSPALRLTRPDGPLNRWTVPRWLGEHGLTYHRRPERWIGATELESVKRGQEFVCDIGDAVEPHRWIEKIVAVMEQDRSVRRQGDT